MALLAVVFFVSQLFVVSHLCLPITSLPLKIEGEPAWALDRSKSDRSSNASPAMISMGLREKKKLKEAKIYSMLHIPTYIITKQSSPVTSYNVPTIANGGEAEVFCGRPANNR